MADDEKGQFLALVDEHRDDIKALLPDYFQLERFIYNARAVLNDSKLWTYKNNRRMLAGSATSLYNCVLEAARRGLEIGGPNKHCAVVVFGSEDGPASFNLLTQWQGKVFQWMKAGAIKKAQAVCVFVGDDFRIELGSEPRILHIPDDETSHPPQWYNDLNNIRGAYAVAILWSGEKAISWVNRSQLNATREWVKNKNKGKLGFGWRDWLPAMCEKTAIHRLDGEIQPPPTMTPEQIEAWNRASTVDTSAVPVDDDEQIADAGELEPHEIPRAREDVDPRQDGEGLKLVKDVEVEQPGVGNASTSAAAGGGAMEQPGMRPQAPFMDGDRLTGDALNKLFMARKDVPYPLRFAAITGAFPDFKGDFNKIGKEHYADIKALLEGM